LGFPAQNKHKFSEDEMNLALGGAFFALAFDLCGVALALIRLLEPYVKTELIY